MVFRKLLGPRSHLKEARPCSGSGPATPGPYHAKCSSLSDKRWVSHHALGRNMAWTPGRTPACGHEHGTRRGGGTAIAQPGRHGQGHQSSDGSAITRPGKSGARPRSNTVATPGALVIASSAIATHGSLVEGIELVYHLCVGVRRELARSAWCPAADLMFSCRCAAFQLELRTCRLPLVARLLFAWVVPHVVGSAHEATCVGTGSPQERRKSGADTLRSRNRR